MKVRTTECFIERSERNKVMRKVAVDLFEMELKHPGLKEGYDAMKLPSLTPKKLEGMSEEFFLYWEKRAAMTVATTFKHRTNVFDVKRNQVSSRNKGIFLKMVEYGWIVVRNQEGEQVIKDTSAIKEEHFYGG